MAVIEQADNPTKKLLDFWHELCLKKVNTSVEVLVFNRRDNPSLKYCKGMVNTNEMVNWQGKVSLGLFLENTSKINYKFVTHELGHWVLKLQGVRGVINKDDKNLNENNFGGSIEMILNSFCSHPALYTLQRSYGA